MADTYEELITQMTENITAIREATQGKEVREHIASGMENVLEVYKNLPPDYISLVNRVVALEACGLTVSDGKLCALYDDGTGQVDVQHVALGYSRMGVTVGESKSVTAIISPVDATNQTTVWSVSPENCATVINGMLKGTKAGDCTLSVAVGDKTTSCAVTVAPYYGTVDTVQGTPEWDTAPSVTELVLPFTPKKSGLKLRSLRFQVKGYVQGPVRIIFRKYSTASAITDESKLVDILTSFVRGYNDVLLDMEDVELEKGVEYQLYFSAANKLYPPSVDPAQVIENDYFDITTGSTYTGGDTTRIFSGRIEFMQEEDNG